MMHKKQKMMKKTGRIIFALPFVVFGAFHLINTASFAGFVPAYIPGPAALWVYVTGIIFLVAAAGLILNKHVREAGWLIAGQLALIILLVHVPNLSNPQLQQIAISNGLKDLALLGAAVCISGVASCCSCMKKDGTCQEGMCQTDCECKGGKCTCGSGIKMEGKMCDCGQCTDCKAKMPN